MTLKETRKKWLKLIGVDNIPQKLLVICEDHFELPDDMSNYTQFCVNGSVKKMILKPGALPSKFDCLQENEEPKKKTEPDKPRTKTVSNESTQTEFEYTGIKSEDRDPLAINELDNCWSSTFTEDAIKLEKISTDEHDEFSYFVVT